MKTGSIYVGFFVFTAVILYQLLSMFFGLAFAGIAEKTEIPHRPEMTTCRGFVSVSGSIWNWNGEKDLYLFSKPGEMGIKFERLAICDKKTYDELVRLDNEAVEILGYKCRWGTGYSWITVIEVRLLDCPLPYEEDELTCEEL